MAEYLNLEQGSIGKFENGERNINVSNLEKACALFGIQTNDIYKKSYNSLVLSPSFKKTNFSTTSLEDVSDINKIAMNIIEMKAILENHNR